jgi:hypothetical protein
MSAMQTSFETRYNELFEGGCILPAGQVEKACRKGLWTPIRWTAC